MDVEAKFAASGKGPLKSLEAAFRICNKSIGERKFGEHAIKKDGTPIHNIPEIARKYEALLIHHRAVILGGLKNQKK